MKFPKLNINASDLPGLVGLALIAAGIWHFSPAVANIVIGAMLVAYSYQFGK